MSTMTLSEELAWRGFTHQTTYKDPSVLDGDPIKFYWGVDPSAPSMTIGNLAAAMMARHFIRAGHQPVLLVGGATGLIGDPDGKAEERTLKSIEEIVANKKAIARQYSQIFDGLDIEVVDNHDWFKQIGYLEFLRDVGKHVPMRQMLGRDFVQARLSEDGAGLSYAEFSYALIQGYDFAYLYKNHGVTLQLCGSDQWGNSIAGVELVRRLHGGEAHIWSAPLVVNQATGRKFGKTEGGAIWLDGRLTSPYQFYQFWLNVDDAGVEDYLKIYTELSPAEIQNIMHRFQIDPRARYAQKNLAREVTQIVHGSEVTESVERITQALFGGKNYAALDKRDMKELARELPTCSLKSVGSLPAALVETGLAKSSSEARRFIDQGGVYINGAPADDKISLDQIHPIADSFIILRRGKNAHALISVK